MKYDAKFEKLRAFLSDSRVPFSRQRMLKYQTYFKSGGVAEFVVSPQSIDQLGVTIRFLKEIGLGFKIVGATSNVWFLDELDYGVVISTLGLVDVAYGDGKFDVQAGYPLEDFVRAALVHGHGGVEGLEGIPGTVGGGIFMNAGAYGSQISDFLTSVICLDLDGNAMRLVRDECRFSYRNSIFRDRSDLVIVAATFDLPTRDPERAAAQIEIYHIARHSYQEFAFPNLGSAFSSGNFYAQIFQRHRIYYFLYTLFRLVFKNPVTKFLFRKNPTNRHLNFLAYRFLGQDLGGWVGSHKSLNILVNKGGVFGIHQMACYLNAMRHALPRSVRIENEIVFSPLRSDEDRALALELSKLFDDGVAG